MVLVNNKKYACESCIKGHRSSACKHTDRPLFEIKKKGRPTTQCDHCRELRKTKQVHVKCICETKEDNPGVKRGHTKVTESATFPHGLPQALEASVAASDSEHSGSCSCKSGGECHCCTPRKSVSRPSRKEERAATRRGQHDGDSRTQTQILTRLAELRPVLPRPPELDANTFQQPSSTLVHGHPSRPHSHEQVSFSPYSKAYDRVSSPHPNYDDTQGIVQGSSQDSGDRSFYDMLQELTASVDLTIPQQRSSSIPRNSTFPSACGCGDACRCPGCIEHNASMPSPSAFSSCTNAGACATCLDCTILSLPTAVPPDAAVSPNDTMQSLAFEEWFRRVTLSSVPLLPDINSPSPSSMDIDTSSLPPVSDLGLVDSLPIVDTGYCSDSSCSCVPGFCSCDHTDSEGYSYTTPVSGLSFATSGERASCCALRKQSVSPSGDTTTSTSAAAQQALSSRRGSSGGYPMMDEANRSRSSSVSSQSSFRSLNPVSFSPNMIPQPTGLAPSGRVQAPSRGDLDTELGSLILSPSHSKPRTKAAGKAALRDSLIYASNFVFDDRTTFYPYDRYRSSVDDLHFY